MAYLGEQQFCEMGFGDLYCINQARTLYYEMVWVVLRDGMGDIKRWYGCVIMRWYG